MHLCTCLIQIYNNVSLHLHIKISGHSKKSTTSSFTHYIKSNMTTGSLYQYKTDTSLAETCFSVILVRMALFSKFIRNYKKLHTKPLQEWMNV